MSNLRSDCRALVADREPGDTWRTNIERLCHQIDEIEERWHRAEREKAHALSQWRATIADRLQDHNRLHREYAEARADSIVAQCMRLFRETDPGSGPLPVVPGDRPRT